MDNLPKLTKEEVEEIIKIVSKNLNFDHICQDDLEVIIIK